MLLKTGFSDDSYFIDVADETISLKCAEDCPDYVGKLVIARPMKIRDIETSDDIQINTCHFTLIESNIALLAAHCAFPWIQNNWREESGEDCSKVFSFYLKDGKMARCRKILTPIEANPNRTHTHPDTLLIELDKFEDTQNVTVNTELIDFRASRNEYIIWGEETGQEDKIVKRKCHQVERSLLTPLRTAGIRNSTFVLLECDGPVVSGWSGAGVWHKGEHIGVVSQAVSTTGYHVSEFGNNKAIVSLNYCAYPWRDETQVSCIVGTDVFLDALKETYYLGIDLAVLWQENTINQLSRHFKAHHLEYIKESNEASLISSRFFQTVCLKKDMFEDNQRNSKPFSFRLLKDVQMDLERFAPKYLKTNSNSSIVGLHGVSSRDEGLGGNFHLPLDFNILDGMIDLREDKAHFYVGAKSFEDLQDTKFEVLSFPFCSF